MTTARSWVALGLGWSMAWLGACSRQESPQERRGKDLFSGAVPLKAHMVGHTTELPPDVTRCQNCHVAAAALPGASAQATRGAGPAEAFAPPLDRRSLTEPRKRRGGPPSVYSRETFCSLLQDGIDPAHVMIPNTMPRYLLSRDDCAALWEHLTSP